MSSAGPRLSRWRCNSGLRVSAWLHRGRGRRRTLCACRLWSVFLRPTRLVALALMALALVLRLYRIADYTVFQGDQGIDALAARQLMVSGVWPVEGPATSAGGVHLG